MSVLYLYQANIVSFVHRVYTEEQPGDAAVMLFIKDLREEDSGQYHCKGFYASTEEMAAEVQISTFSKHWFAHQRVSRISNPQFRILLFWLAVKKIVKFGFRDWEFLKQLLGAAHININHEKVKWLV